MPKGCKLTYPGKKSKYTIIHKTPCVQLEPVKLFRGETTLGTDWVNMLIFGDNLPVLKSMLGELKGKIRLIYIDGNYTGCL